MHLQTENPIDSCPACDAVAAVPVPNFKTLFCKRFGCRTERFEERLFWEAVNPNAKPSVWFMKFFGRRLFEPDFHYIRRLAVAGERRDVIAIVNYLPFDPRFGRGLLRGALRARISGRRLIEIADEIFQAGWRV